jgi:hypothetical protein
VINSTLGINLPNTSLYTAGATAGGDVTLANVTPTASVSITKSSALPAASFVGSTIGAADVASGVIDMNGGNFTAKAGRDYLLQSVMNPTLSDSGAAEVRISATRDFVQSGGANLRGSSEVVTAGRDISIGETIGANSALTMVAGRDIVNHRGGLQIFLNLLGGVSNLSMIAGADFSDSGSSITINGPSTTGGKIDFNGSGGSLNLIRGSGTAVSNGNFSTINMVAYEGSDHTGYIRANGGTFAANSTGTGTNGDLIFVAGKPNQTNTNFAIDLTGAFLNNAGSTTGGSITLANVTPNGNVTIDKTTALPASSFVGTTLGGGDIATSGIDTNVGTYTLKTGHDYLFQGTINPTYADAGGSTVRISAPHDFIQSGGAILRGGSVVVTAGHDISLGETLGTNTGMTVVAGHDIINHRAGLQIYLNLVGGTSNLTMVAGANFTDNGSSLTINGPSATGGTINFNGSGGSLNAIFGQGTAASNGNGSTINLIAYEGSEKTGNILANSGTFAVQATGTGATGTLNMVAGKSDQTGSNYAIDLGSNAVLGLGGAYINSAGSTTGGSITLVNVTPNSSVSIDKTTVLPSTSFVDSTVGGADVATGTVDTNTGSFTVKAGHDYLFQGAMNPTLSDGGASVLRISAGHDFIQSGGANLRGSSQVITAGHDISLGEMSPRSL